MSESFYTTVIFGEQNQKIKLEKSYVTFCQKLKQAFHIDWDITSLQYDKEIYDQITYDEYIKGKTDSPIEINYSFDILKDYIEETIKEYLDSQYDKLFSSIRNYIRQNLNFEIITQLNKKLNEISIEPNFSKISFKSTQEYKKNDTNQCKTIYYPMNKNTNSNISTNIRENPFQSSHCTQSTNNSRLIIPKEEETLKDSFRKTPQVQSKKQMNQIGKAMNGPTKVVITNPIDMSPSAFLNEIDKEYKILKKFPQNTINQCYKKNISEEEYLNNLYKNKYISLDDFSFE